jgi:site-specific DNA recombinase
MGATLSTMTTATIYLRQSFDKDGEGAAVSRQLEACRELCEAKGWTVAKVLTDNDVSATTGRVRPSFETLLTSNPRRIVVWHVDRLVRLSKDLERVIELGVNVYAVKSGHVDLSNPAGRAVAKTVIAWAQYEGEQKATRQVAANLQRAQRGQVLWSRRPFGFDRTGSKVRVVKSEAEQIRKAATRVLAGTALACIATKWNARGMTTTAGGAWSATALRHVLLNPRTAGRVVSQGTDYGSNGFAILDADTADRLSALMRDPGRRSAPSTTVKHLLSGMVRCGRPGCDSAVMYASSDREDRLSYRCLSCRGTRRLARVDEVVMAAVVARLTRRDAAGLLDRDVDLDDLRERVVDLRGRRDGLAALLADGLLTPAAVRTQAQRLTDQISGLERQIEASVGTSPLARVIDSGDVAAALGRMSLLEVREVIKELMDVRILPAGKGVRFDPEQVRIQWKDGGQ